jgi:tetrahydromethanopterin S-methyltransferase subunit E
MIRFWKIDSIENQGVEGLQFQNHFALTIKSRLYMDRAKQSNLFVLKLIHTLIWLFFNVVLFYMAYAVVVNKIDKYVWIGIGLILLEGIVLLIFGRMCPLTVLARKYSDSTKDNFDIFLPNWLARHNKLIYTTLFVVICILLAFRLHGK